MRSIAWHNSRQPSPFVRWAQQGIWWFFFLICLLYSGYAFYMGAVEILLDGVDLSLAMLRQAHRLLNQMGLQYTLTQQDVCTLQFPSATFDLVMSAHVLEHVSDPPAALWEMVRVLRPDAPLLLLVSQPGILTTFIQLRWRYVAHTANQIKQWINEAGVRDVHIYPLQGVLPSRTSLAYLGFKAE